MHISDQAETTVQQKTSTSSFRFFCCITLLMILSASALLFYAVKAPGTQKESKLEVRKGMSVLEITKQAETMSTVKSYFLLYAILHYQYNPKNIYAGTYSFADSDNVFEVAKKLAHSDIDQQLISLTIPEGTTRKEIAQNALSKNSAFDVALFLKETKDKEGYLFPETYFLPPEFTVQQLIIFIEKTYEERMSPLRPQISVSKLSEYQVLILASLLERETNSPQSAGMVAGILENRMKAGMALQVDASLEYILDKPLKNLSPEDLKVDSPYNTYLYTGLPPTPIGNPGLFAITAVLNPTPSPYFFYITDKDGVFHYAKTFTEHKLNIAKYLK